MNVQPSVSVVIPTYNRLGLLREAVDSVLGQTHAARELIVVDDGSTDGTAAYLRELGGAGVRAIVVAHGGNLARVRNLGARVAAGRYLAFLDSDDVWLPEKLEVQLRAMAAAGARWSYTRYEHMNERGETVPPRAGEWRALSGDIAVALLSDRASVSMPTVVVERELFDAVGGFDEDARLNLREDFDLELRLALAAEALAVPEVLTRVRVHAGRTTNGVRDGQLRTARVVGKLLRELPPGEARRAARRRYARCLLGAVRERVGYGR